MRASRHFSRALPTEGHLRPFGNDTLNRYEYNVLSLYGIEYPQTASPTAARGERGCYRHQAMMVGRPLQMEAEVPAQVKQKQ